MHTESGTAVRLTHRTELGGLVRLALLALSCGLHPPSMKSKHKGGYAVAERTNDTLLVHLFDWRTPGQEREDSAGVGAGIASGSVPNKPTIQLGLDVLFLVMIGPSRLCCGQQDHI